MPNGSCRLCRAYCDWVIDPVGCIDARCANLYGYDDAAGRRVVGCLERVFEPELDLAAFLRLRSDLNGRGGGLRAARRPLPICRGVVEQAFRHRLPAAGCVNPEFAEPLTGDPFRVARGVS
jgi:hypothetical protein